MLISDPISKRQGFSIVETLLALALLSLALVLSLSSLRINPTSGDARALSMELKALFTQARAQAIAKGVPVGLAFPPGNGSAPVSQSYLLLEGRALARVQRERSFLGDFPQQGIFVGQWTTVSGTNFAAAVALPDSEVGRFDWASWLPAELVDHAVYVYLPSGSLVTNSQSALSGEYPLVVSDRFAYVGDPPVLASTGDSHTLLVSTRSTVRTQKGVPDSDLSSGGQGAESWSATSATLPENPDEGPPMVTAVNILPVTVDDEFAEQEGIHALVQPGNLLTFEILAKDPNGDPLTCKLTGAGGTFTHSGALPMLYVPETGEWRSIWQWRAPPGASVDEIIEITVQVRDQTSTATAAANVELQPKVLVVPDGFLLFTSSGASSSALYTCRFDGTELKALYTPYGPGDASSLLGSPSLSHNGERVVVGSDRADQSLKVFSSQAGREPHAQVFHSLAGPAGQTLSGPVFGASGTMIYCWATPEKKTYSLDLDGGSTLTVIPGRVAGVSLDGDLALYTSDTAVGLWKLEDPGSGDAIPPIPDFFGVGMSETHIFLGEVTTSTATFDLYKCPLAGPLTPEFLATVPYDSAIGGNGRYVFYPTTTPDPAIWRLDLQTNTRNRLVTNQNGFFGPIDHFRELSASK